MAENEKLVPQRRFREFQNTQVWEQRKFKDFTKLSQGLQIAISERYIEPGESREFYITNEFLNSKSNKKYYIENASKNVIADEKDILMTRTGNTGEVVTDTKGAFHNNFFKIAYNSDETAKLFLYYLLNSAPIQKDILVRAGTSTIPDLNHNDFYEIKVATPKFEEQQRIGSFFKQIDDAIALHQRKLEKTKELKYAYLSEMFPSKGESKPKRRFAGFTDAWEQGKIGDFGYFYYGKSAPKWSVTQNAKTPCVRYGELYTKYSEKIDMIYSYTNIPRENLKFSTGKEVLVPRVGEEPLDFANCSWLSMPDVAIGEMISVYNTEQNPLFTTYMFNGLLKHEFAKRVEGGNVSNLYYAYLEDIPLSFPSIDEQIKITTFFDSLTNLITLHQRKLEKLQNIKKAFLNEMFV